MAAEPTLISPPRPRTEPPVFVDPGGGRARRLRVVVAAAALAGLLVLGALVLGSLGVGGLPGLSAVLGHHDAPDRSPAGARLAPSAPAAAAAGRPATARALAGAHDARPAAPRRRADQLRAGRQAPANVWPRRSPGTAVAAPVRPVAVDAPPAHDSPAARPAPARRTQRATHRPAWSGGSASRTTPPPGQAKTPGTPAKPKSDPSSATTTNGKSATTPAAERKATTDPAPPPNGHSAG